MRYTDKIMNIVTAALAKYGPINEEISELERQYQQNRITGSVFREKKDALERQREAIRMTAYQEIEGVRPAYHEYVMKATEVSGAMLHEDAKLLTLDGLTLTPRQFTALVEKHKDNVLMTSLLKDYANAHEGLYADYIPGPDEKIRGFDGYADAANNTLRSPTSLQAAFFLDGKYTPAYCTEEE